MSRGSSRKGYLVFIILLGAISGSFIGDILGSNIKMLHFLKDAYPLSMKPTYFDLKVLGITFGINFKVNIMSIIGVILAIIVYRKY